MNNVIKNGFYTIVGLLLVGLNTVNAFSVSSTKEGGTGDNLKSGTFIDTLDAMLGYLIGLLYFIAVVFALYGGFQILTAGGDEEKVKKGKTTLINAVIGLVVIFLASQIVSWIVLIMGSGGDAVT